MLRLGLLLTVTITIACSHLVHVDRPYLLIHFPELDFFVEGEANVEVVRPLDSADFGLIQEEGFAPHRYRAVGDGAFVVRDHECLVVSKTVSCDGKELDKSLGGVVLKKTGEFVAVNPLTVSAK